MADTRAKNKVPKTQRKMPLDMPMSLKSLENGRFMPRKESPASKPGSTTRNGVLPSVQPRRKPVLKSGVYGE